MPSTVAVSYNTDHLCVFRCDQKLKIVHQCSEMMVVSHNTRFRTGSGPYIHRINSEVIAELWGNGFFMEARINAGDSDPNSVIFL